MKRNHSTVEVALETAGTVRDVAWRAERMARRVLRRTRLIARRAARGLPGEVLEEAQNTAITLVLPPTSAPDEQAHQLVELRRRAERAEHAAAWLRARLRAERARHKVVAPLDVEALAADLTRELTMLRAQSPEAVGRVVRRTLMTHGLPMRLPAKGERPAGNLPLALPGWPRERQQAVAAQVLARVPEVSDAFYVYRVLALVAAGGRHTLPDLLRAAGLDSAMARRRLRLATEALVALGALALQGGTYTLNMETTRRGSAHVQPNTPAPTGMAHKRVKV